MSALNRLAWMAAAWTVTSAAAPVPATAPEPVTFTMKLQRTGPKLILTSTLRNNRTTPVCINRTALDPVQVLLLRAGRPIKLKPEYFLLGRPLPGCQVLAPGQEYSLSYDIMPRYRQPPRRGDLVCDQETWGEIQRRNDYDDMAAPERSLKRCVGVK